MPARLLGDVAAFCFPEFVDEPSFQGLPAQIEELVHLLRGGLVAEQVDVAIEEPRSRRPYALLTRRTRLLPKSQM